VVSRIVSSEDYTSRNQRLRRVFTATLAGILILLGAFGVGAKVLLNKAADANSKAVAADERRINSESRAREVEQKVAGLNTQIGDLGLKVKTAQGDLDNAQIELGTTKQTLETTKTDLKDQVALLATQRIKGESARMAFGVGQNVTSVTPSELDLIWDLSAATDQVKDSFISQMLASPVTARRFSNRRSLLAHAIVGLSPEKQNEVLERDVVPCLRTATAPAAERLACFDLGAQMGVRHTEFAVLGLPVAIAAMKDAGDAGQLERRATDLTAIVYQLEGEPVARAFRDIVATVVQKHFVSSPGVYGLMQTVTEKYAVTNARLAFDRLVEAFNAVPDESDDAQALHFWITAISHVPGTMTSEQRKIVLPSLIANVSSRDDEALRGETLRLGATKVSEVDAPDAMAQLLTEFEAAKFGFVKKHILNGIDGLMSRLDTQGSAKALNLIVENVINAEYPHDLQILFPTATKLAQKSSAEGRRAATARLSKVLRGDAAGGTHYVLRISLLVKVADSLLADDARQFLLMDIASFENDSVPRDFYDDHVAGAVGLASLMQPADARRVLLAAIDKAPADRPSVVGFLIHALGGVRDIPADELRRAFRKAIDTQTGRSGGGGFDGRTLVQGMTSLAKRIDSRDKLSVCSDLEAAMSLERAGGTFNLEVTAPAIAVVPAPDCDSAKEHALQLVALNPPELRNVNRDGSQITKWISLMRLLPGKLTAQTSNAAMAGLLSQFQEYVTSTSTFDVSRLRDEFVVVVEKSKSEDMPSQVAQIVTAFNKLDAGEQASAQADDFNFGPRSEEQILEARVFLAEYLAALPADLTSADVAYFWKTLVVAANKGGTNPSDVRAGLMTLSKRIPSSEASAYAEPMLSAMAQLVPGETRALYNELLPLVVARTTPSNAPQLFVGLSQLVARATDQSVLESAAGAMNNLPGEVDVDTQVDFLKWPVCVGPLRMAVIRRLGRQVGQEYGDDEWAVVRWARSVGINTNSPPSRP
jgi:hypothetical protein